MSSHLPKDPKYLKDVAELLAEEWEARTAAGQITFSFGNFKCLDQTQKFESKNASLVTSSMKSLITPAHIKSKHTLLISLSMFKSRCSIKVNSARRLNFKS